MERLHSQEKQIRGGLGVAGLCCVTYRYMKCVCIAEQNADIEICSDLTVLTMKLPEKFLLVHLILAVCVTASWAQGQGLYKLAQCTVYTNIITFVLLLLP